MHGFDLYLDPDSEPLRAHSRLPSGDTGTQLSRSISCTEVAPRTLVLSLMGLEAPPSSVNEVASSFKD